MTREDIGCLKVVAIIALCASCKEEPFVTEYGSMTRDTFTTADGVVLKRTVVQTPHEKPKDHVLHQHLYRGIITPCDRNRPLCIAGGDAVCACSQESPALFNHCEWLCE